MNGGARGQAQSSRGGMAAAKIGQHGGSGMRQRLLATQHRRGNQYSSILSRLFIGANIGQKRGASGNGAGRFYHLSLRGIARRVIIVKAARVSQRLGGA